MNQSGPRPKRSRYCIPYGIRTCADGTQILFNRSYRPIWRREPGQSAKPAQIDDRVAWTKQEWFFDDGNPPWGNGPGSKKAIDRCEAVLMEWGVGNND